MDSFVQHHLKEIGLEDWITKFEEEEIDEGAFLQLSEGDIEKLIGAKIGPKRKLVSCIEALRRPTPSATKPRAKIREAQAHSDTGAQTHRSDIPANGPAQEQNGVIDTRPLPKPAELIEIFNDASKPSTPIGPPKPTKTINILLLGETGVGKSTWINGFTNYLKFATLDEAVAAPDLTLPIPINFQFTDPHTYETVTIKAGAVDDNELQVPGFASTQSPRSYKFTTSDGQSICLIDTPGICDPEGIDADKLHLEDIMLYLSTINQLHGICILLRPNVVKLSIQFQFCIKQLLARLHRSAVGNVVFCFTNTRTTYYGPGDTLPNLKLLLSSHKTINTEVPVTRETYYCVDNEAVRFLAAMRNGVQFEDDMVADFSNSWARSVKEMQRMIQYVIKLPPHDVEDTRKLNEVRDIVIRLTGPLAQFATKLEDSKIKLEAKQLELKQTQKKGADLNTILYIPATNVTLEPTEPSIVCTDRKCSENVVVDGQNKVHDKIRCHTPCNCIGVPSEIAGAPGLRRCSAFAFSLRRNLLQSGWYCKLCQCSWLKHMRIEYEVKCVEGTVLDKEINEQLEGVHDDIEKKNRVLGILRDRIKEEEEEQKRMLQISSKFAHFLSRYAIALYNDAMHAYLLMSIEMEQTCPNDSADSPRKIQGLRNMLAAYEEEVKILEASAAAVASNGTEELVRAEDIQDLIEETYKLKLHGSQLKEFMDNKVQKSIRFKNRAKIQNSSIRNWMLRQEADSGNALQDWMKQVWEPAEKPMPKQRPDKAKARKLKQKNEQQDSVENESGLLERMRGIGVKVMDSMAGGKKN